MTKRGNRVLFVYGSLKRGGRHHAELRGARFIGQAVAPSGYALEALGEYLVLVPRAGALGAVPGELFEVDDALLGLLDEFEGPDYERRYLKVGLEAAMVRDGEQESETDDQADDQTDDETDDEAAEFPAKRLVLAYLRRTR